MKVAFRVDASLEIGTGHVMRCLTLAKVLTKRGAECHFLTREHPGHLINLIRDCNFGVHVLPSIFRTKVPESIHGAHLPAHAEWLGATQQQDADACNKVLSGLCADLLIVDHYAIGSQWERFLKPLCRRLMVIDDLADRQHFCDLIVDQTLGRNAGDYRELVPDCCVLLCGADFAILRPEFSELRSYSLARRECPQLKNLMVTMGGVDRHNATGEILKAIKFAHLPIDCTITVVMGGTAPWLDEVRKLAAQLPWQAHVKVDVRNMAELMAESDLAIGAAGATSWERCCLGLPTIMLVLAENQRMIASSLMEIHAALVLSGIDQLTSELPSALSAASNNLLEMSKAARQVTDGDGSNKILKHMVL